MAIFFVEARDPLYNNHIVDDDAPVGCVRSALATVLLDQWAWGGIAAPQVKHMAQAAITDGSQHPDLLRLASVIAIVIYRVCF